MLDYLSSPEDTYSKSEHRTKTTKSKKSTKAKVTSNKQYTVCRGGAVSDHFGVIPSGEVMK